MPIKPRPAASATRSRGKTAVRSISAARGATRLRANAATSETKPAWSADREKSMGTFHHEAGEQASRRAGGEGGGGGGTQLSPFPLVPLFPCSPATGKRRERRADPLAALRQLLRQHPGVANRAHEVRVAVPPRHDV